MYCHIDSSHVSSNSFSGPYCVNYYYKSKAETDIPVLDFTLC